MTIKYLGEVYRDDRMFVLNLSYGSYSKRYGALSTPIEEGDAWILTTYRNTVELPIITTDIFHSVEDARAYIVKIEHTTPLISLKEKPLEIPKKIQGMDHIPESERPWEFYNRWLAINGLFGAITAGFPNKHKQHCPYWKDEKGYTLIHTKSIVQTIVDGLEEDVLNDDGNYHDNTWERGLRNGLSIEYFGKPKGPVHIKMYYKDGEPHGPYERFYENGQLRSKGQLTDGVQTGYWEWFDEDGKLNKKGTFENGELNEE